MTIDYLQKLRDIPSDGTTNRGISLLEITHLEQVFNNGNLFPKVLKEFLYLAGDYCYVMDTGSWDSIEEMNIEHYMTKNVICVGPDESLLDIANKFLTTKKRNFPAAGC